MLQIRLQSHVSFYGPVYTDRTRDSHLPTAAHGTREIDQPATLFHFAKYYGYRYDDNKNEAHLSLLVHTLRHIIPEKNRCGHKGQYEKESPQSSAGRHFI